MAQNINVRNFAGFAIMAAAINSVVFLIAKSVDATMVINQGGAREIGLPMVLGATLVGLLVAAFIASKIGAKSEGFVSRAPLIGLLFGIITAAAPFTATEDTKTAMGLGSMHVIAGLVWYFGAKRSTH